MCARVRHPQSSPHQRSAETKEPASSLALVSCRKRHPRRPILCAPKLLSQLPPASAGTFSPVQARVGEEQGRGLRGAGSSPCMPHTALSLPLHAPPLRHCLQDVAVQHLEAHKLRPPVLAVTLHLLRLVLVVTPTLLVVCLLGDERRGHQRVFARPTVQIFAKDAVHAGLGVVALGVAEGAEERLAQSALVHGPGCSLARAHRTADA